MNIGRSLLGIAFMLIGSITCLIGRTIEGTLVFVIGGLLMGFSIKD